MTLRRQLKRIEHGLRGTLESFALEDGSTYFYDPLEAHKEMFAHAYDLQLGDAHKWEEPPEIYQKVCEAKDPALVLQRFKPESPVGAFVDVTQIYDEGALVNERRLVPLYHAPVEDLSE